MIILNILLLINNHYELFSIFNPSIKKLKDQFGVSIQTFRSDNAFKYMYTYPSKKWDA